MQKNLQPKKGSLKTFPERFSNSDGEAEKQKGAFNIQPKKASMEAFRGIFNNGEKQNSAFNIQPKKTPVETFLERFNNIDCEGEKRKDACEFELMKTLLDIYT